ncbi:WxL domain-containing protein [Furfurilactobacillus sp. WILCCON 0119]
MLKRATIIGAMATAVLLLGPAIGVHAAGDVGTAHTEVTASFLPGSGPSGPVDPTNPGGGPVINPGNPGTGATGPLRLNYVSNLIDFGANPISSSNQTYTAKATSDMINGYQSAQVSDERGTTAGWALKVSGSPMKAPVTSDTLTGATLTLPAGTVATASGTSNGAVATAVSNALDSSGGVLLGAAAGNGAGLTVDRWQPSAVQLQVMGGTAKAEAYSTDLTWTLQDAPA